MHPWIAGRIVETMQQQNRAASEHARLGREAAGYRRNQHESRATHTEEQEPRRARVGLAVARLGLRIAGQSDGATLPPTSASGRAVKPSLNPDHWSNPWTTCGATSTSTH